MSHVREADGIGAVHTTRVLARLLAVLVVFIMVSTAFVAALANAEGAPEVWTSKDEYSPGETVEIYGGGWVKWVPVTVTISHPDLVEKSFVVIPDLYGRFVCTDYVAELVKDYSTAVTVTATQVLENGDSVATTHFYDPAAYIEGWTLFPHQRWTTGDLKGWNEGDSVPMMVVINKKQLHGSNEVTMTIGVDMYNKTPSMAYGIDYLTEYWTNPPVAPFNTYTNSSQPFYVDPAEGTLSDVQREANIYDEGRKLTEQVWSFTFTFADGSTRAMVRFGAHLAVTNLDEGIRGASYWPGESLHVRIVEMNPDVNNGNRDVPISVKELTGPPELELMKECDPEVVLEGDTITFTVHWMNTGGAPAYCAKLWDELPLDAVELDPDSFLYWDTTNPTPMTPFPGPVTTSTGWEWDIGYVPAAQDGVPFEAWLSFEATVITSETGWYENWVYLSYTDNHGSSFPTLSAECEFYIPPPPSIEVVKSGPYYAHDGDVIEYTYVVTNTGPADLIHVDVVDSIIGTIATDLSIEAGDSVTLTATYTVKSTDPSILENTVTASGEDEYGREVMDDDSWTVLIFRPHIDIEKSVSMECAKAGETVWYTLDWINPPEWETTLYNVTIKDSLLGDYEIGTLAPGATGQLVIPYVVTDAWDPLINTVEISGEDWIHGIATDSDSASVDVVHPMVQISKTADKACGLPGEAITYTITVTNPSAADVWLNGSYGDSVLKLEWTFEDLKPGESVSQVIPTTIPDTDPFVNSAWVTARDHQDHVVQATASYKVDVVHPDVEITKDVDEHCGMPGETVTFTITVTNPACTDVWLNGTVYDPLLGGPWAFSNLKPGDTFVLELPYVLPDSPTEIFNTASVEAFDHQNHKVTATSKEVRVDVVHPDVEISKEASMPCAAVGESITWTITVTNPATADVWLNGTVTDDVLGQTWEFFNLKPGQFIEFTYTQVMPEGPTEIINTATVSATDHQDHEVTATSNAVRVDIVHPDVEITKKASMPCAGVGEEITWTITVTNPETADVMLNGTVTDPMFQKAWTFNNLQPGESVDFTYDQIMPEGPTEIINTAYVEATDHQDHVVRDASGPVRVDIVHPDVKITKSASMACAAVGEEITWTITVTNPGTADVMINGTVDDSVLGKSWSFTNLAPGQSVDFTYTQEMPEGLTEIINTATVVATDHQEHEVTATSNAVRVDIVHPAVEITKVSDKPCAAVGELVTYTITVTNPASADVWLNGTISDPALGESWTFMNLAPGEQVIKTATIPMPFGPTEFINTATVTAKDHQNHVVSASASVRVDIVHPDIEITKKASMPCAAVGEEITWTITVTNPATADVMLNGTVTDPMFQKTWTFNNLNPGDSVDFTYDQIMPEGPTEIINTAYVEATDHQQHVVRAASEPVRVDIVHPDVEITKVADQYLAHDGDVITYTITVYNPATADVMLNGTVDDTMFGDGVLSFTYLAPGNSVSATMTYTVLATDPETIENKATVTATDHQDHEVTAEATWTVQVLRPDIDVTKIGPVEAEVGEVITYYVNVTNTGNCDLFNVSVQDTLGGELGPIAILLKGETKHLTYDYIVPSGPGTLDNTVVAKGEDRLHLWVDDKADWQVIKLAVVMGLKAADYNANGIYDVGEPGLMNWLIVLEGTDADGPVYKTTLTDSFGEYEFTRLKPGTYTVSETMLPGWHNFSALSYALTLDSGSLEVRDFLNMPYGTISGYKFLDLNMNGVWDDGEEAIPGWGISLSGTTIGGLPVIESTTTDADGAYSFVDLMPGVYFVSEETRDGWYATTPTMLTVDAGSLDPFVVTDQDFGNVPLGEISGFKWLDENMNGYEDGTEPKLGGWTIVLDGVQTDGMPVHKETVTGPTGYYYFSGLKPGVYTVSEVLKEGWKNITPLSKEITIIPGSEVTCAKFGNVPYGCIQGWKFLDWDMDGTKDGDEPGIEGWKMTLTGYLNDGPTPYGMDGTPVGPIDVFTDEDGAWQFCDLLPGIYFVTEESRENWYHTTPLTLSFQITPWHLEETECGMIIVIGGTHVVDVKFGNVPYTCLYGHKWNDLNGDGVHQDNEPGLAGWTIHVVGERNDGVPVDMTLLTDQDGYWATCFNILPGTYTVSEVLQEGWTPTTPESIEVTLEMTMQPESHELNFMNFQNGKITGYKYEDMNGDGILDAGDVAIQNWIIRLENSAHETIATTLTASDGSFEFTGLPFGTYYVVEESLTGWVAMGPTSVKVDVSSGTEVALAPFLNVELSEVFGYKFNDLNGNGVRDEGEPGIPGWTIYLIWDKDPTTYSTTTNENGYYEFSDLMPDSYYMVFEEQRDGWTPTNATWEEFSVTSGTSHRVHDFMNFENVTITIFKFNDVNGNGQYDLGIDSGMVWTFEVTDPKGVVTTVTTDSSGGVLFTATMAGVYTVEEIPVMGWNPTTPTVQTVTVTSGQATPSDLYFGNFKCVDVVLFKYEDKNGNGIYDNDDEPIEGWSINVLNSTDGDPVTLTTDADGKIYLHYCGYESSVLVWEIVPEGWCQITPQAMYYEFQVTSGTVVNLATELEQYQYDFGNFEFVRITVFKFWDKCSNGWFDPDFGDEPLEGWYFELYNGAGQLVSWGVTDEHGYLNFSLCEAGTFTVVEEDREGWSHIRPEGGSYTFDVVSGDEVRLEFANYEHVKVPVFKYEDVDSDGMYDPEVDRPIAGWHFDLVRTGDGFTYSGETGPDGTLEFEVNRSGTYRLVEEDRIGWTHVNPASGMTLLTIISGTIIPVQMFGNFHKVCIPVFKFSDIDGDGYFEPLCGEQPIQGWNFTLWEFVDCSWVEIVTKATDVNGFACFCVDHAGLYKITEEARAGWIWIVPRSGEYIVSVESGDEFQCPFVFGNFKFGKITGHKYNDLNGNGMFDEGEPGLAGWVIHFEVDWPFYMTGKATTDENGYYEFTGLPPGVYDVWEEGQEGWVPTSPSEVTVEIQGDSHEVVDFLNFAEGCVEGYKYEDVNDNGVYDPAVDRPIEGWEITLAITTGVVGDPPMSAIMIIGETTTDADGHYQFCGLGPGLYVVSEETRSDWVPTSPTSSGNMLLPSGGTLRFDFLNFHPGSIYGYKFEDKNSNGVWDDGEPAIEGWKIYMIEDALPTIYTTYTNANGFWIFDDLRADYYMVWEEGREHWTNTTQWWYEVNIYSGMDVRVPDFGNFHNVCIPIFKFNDMNGNGIYEVGTDLPIEGWEFTVDGPAFVGGKTVLTGADGRAHVEANASGWYTVTEADVPGWIHTTDASVTFEIESGDMLKTLRFGNFETGLITGYKYYDWNVNGVRDEGEQGLQNWVIVLEKGEVKQTALTDSTGYYEFTGITAGDYTLYEDLLVAPPGWAPTTAPSVSLSIGSGSVYEVLFGNAVYGHIEGTKFYDKNLNGVRDSNEPGLEGWTITLTGTTDHGLPVSESTTTGPDGHYEFTGLLPGSYSISEVMPGTEWMATTTLPQVRDSSGAMVEWNFTVDIGNVRYAKIWGYKFLDTYAEDYPFWPNGMFDEDESGIGNWEITLQGWTDTGIRVDEVRYTDNVHDIGLYCFDDLLPGRYWVNETMLFGYYATRPVSNLVMIYPFPMGPVCIRIDFGNLLPSPDPEVPFLLEQGWNLWSTPLFVDGLTAKTLLEAIGPSAQVISKLDVANGKYMSYVPVFGDAFNFPIVVGEGYYVYVSQQTTFTLTGELRSSGVTIDVSKGWNLIGYTQLAGTKASKVLSSGDGCTVQVVSYYDAQDARYMSFVNGFPSAYDFKVTSGRAYFVYVDADGTLSL